MEMNRLKSLKRPAVSRRVSVKSGCHIQLVSSAMATSMVTSLKQR